MSSQLPTEIIDEIISYLPEIEDRINVALVNKKWNFCVIPLVYRHLDISETTECSRRHDNNTAPSSRMLCLARTLAENPLLGSYVQSIYHNNQEASLYRVGPKIELCLPAARTYLKAAIEKSSLPFVKRLELHSPDTEIANILLNGLLPTLQSLRISSSFIKHYNFSPAPQLEELNLEFQLDRYQKTTADTNCGPSEAWAKRFQQFLAEDEAMHKNLNAFLKTCQKLRVLKIFNTKELHTILDSSVVLPCLKTLDIGPIQNRVTDLALVCVASFLKNNPSIERLGIGFMRDRPDELGERVTISEASRKNIKELVTYFEDLPDGYPELVEQFTNLESFKLTYDGSSGSLSDHELLSLMKNLRNSKIKRIELPMPSHIGGWALESDREAMVRDTLREFGAAFVEHLPHVEELKISQPGRLKLPINEWITALKHHPSLRALYTTHHPPFPEYDMSRKPFKYDQYVQSQKEYLDNFIYELASMRRLERVVYVPDQTSPEAVEITISKDLRGESLGAKIKHFYLWDWQKENMDPFIVQILRTRSVGLPTRVV